MAKTYKDILQQIEKLKEQAEVMRKREAAGVVKRIRDAIATYGISTAELYPGGKPVSKPPVKKPHKAKPTPKKTGARPKRPVKYSDGKNNWSGGGSMPVWLREYKEAGNDIEFYRIKDKTS